jgi:TRAP transporter TAXI family solute receptor
MRRKWFVLWASCVCFVAVGFFLSTPAAAQKVSVGGGPIGGTFYVLASGFAKILTENVGLSASVEVTAGSTHSVQLVDAKKQDFGISNAGVLYSGITGTNWAKGKKYENVRVLFAMQLSYVHFWTLKKTGIRSIDDLNGRIINLSAKGSGAEVVGNDIIKQFGLKPKKITYLGHTEANDSMVDGLVDAALTSGGLPHPAIYALSSTHEVVIFSLVGDQIKAFQKTHPFHVKADIPAKTYPGQDKPIPAVGDWNLMLVHKDMPEELAYKVVRATFDNIDKWIAVHKSAKETKPENIIGLEKYPIHPGAVRYYREKGLLK